MFFFSAFTCRIGVAVARGLNGDDLARRLRLGEVDCNEIGCSGRLFGGPSPVQPSDWLQDRPNSIFTASI